MIRYVVAILAVAGLIAGCSSSSGGKRQIEFGTPPAQIARELGVCQHPFLSYKRYVVCKFADSNLAMVHMVTGPADQQEQAKGVRKIPFCEVLGHGFVVVAFNYHLLRTHVNVNRIIARYGGRLLGETC